MFGELKELGYIEALFTGIKGAGTKRVAENGLAWKPWHLSGLMAKPAPSQE